MRGRVKIADDADVFSEVLPLPGGALDPSSPWGWARGRPGSRWRAS
ncbi:hypothetical protein I546_3420 [Mycobacterium kansasii 732]|nr:hypothetical protein I546_3420 [Mycobacterium kansasii 732]